MGDLLYIVNLKKYYYINRLSPQIIISVYGILAGKIIICFILKCISPKKSSGKVPELLLFMR